MNNREGLLGACLGLALWCLSPAPGYSHPPPSTTWATLGIFKAQYPGWLGRLLTHPVHGLDSFEEMIRLLTEEKGAVKVFVEVNGHV